MTFDAGSFVLGIVFEGLLTIAVVFFLCLSEKHSKTPPSLPEPETPHLTLEDIKQAAGMECGGYWPECQECFTCCMIHNSRPGCYSCYTRERHAEIEKKKQELEILAASLKELGYTITKEEKI